MSSGQLKKLDCELRANSDLKACEYSTPALGLVLLKFADNKYRQFEGAILGRK